MDAETIKNSWLRGDYASINSIAEPDTSKYASQPIIEEKAEKSKKLTRTQRREEAERKRMGLWYGMNRGDDAKDTNLELRAINIRSYGSKFYRNDSWEDGNPKYFVIGHYKGPQVGKVNDSLIDPLRKPKKRTLIRQLVKDKVFVSEVEKRAAKVRSKQVPVEYVGTWNQSRIVE